MQSPAFLRSTRFWLNLLIILALIGLLLFGTLKWLASYTKHGEFVLVPDFTGKNISALEGFVAGKGVNYLIIDSVYLPSEKPGIVLRQDPDPNAKVKHNRTVYLYVTGMVPPQVAMPKLIDRSERQARLIISSYGLKVGQVSEKRGDCNGCVIGQSVKGRPIEPGAPVKKGSTVDLVVGRNDPFFVETRDSTAADPQ